MKLDGQRLLSLMTKEDTYRLLDMLSEAVAEAIRDRSHEVETESFLQALNGSNDCVELTLSCDDERTIAVHDTNENGCITLMDKQTNCLHIACHRLWEFTIRFSPLTFFFIDLNYPEVLYFGDRNSFDYIRDEGGYPKRWNGPIGPEGSIVEHCGTDWQVIRAPGFDGEFPAPTYPR